MVSDLTPQLRQQFDIPREIEGALVTNVDEDSAAWESALRPGDVIREINKQGVKDAEQAIELAQNLDKAKILLKVWRNGGNRFVVVDESKESKADTAKRRFGWCWVFIKSGSRRLGAPAFFVAFSGRGSRATTGSGVWLSGGPEGTMGDEPQARPASPPRPPVFSLFSLPPRRARRSIQGFRKEGRMPSTICAYMCMLFSAPKIAKRSSATNGGSVSMHFLEEVFAPRGHP